MSAPWPYRYRAKLARLIDGDTLRVVADLGVRTAAELVIRLRGCNAAEKGTAMGEAATVFAGKWLEQYASDDDWLLVVTHKDPEDKFGRWLADVQSIDGARDLATDLIAQGLAVKWTGRGEKPEPTSTKEDR